VSDTHFFRTSGQRARGGELGSHYDATKAGLHLAIVNAEKLEPFASIPTEERRLAESLLFSAPRAKMANPLWLLKPLMDADERR
jgi:cobalamin-dependent methionine synthase I